MKRSDLRRGGQRARGAIGRGGRSLPLLAVVAAPIVLAGCGGGSQRGAAATPSTVKTVTAPARTVTTPASTGPSSADALPALVAKNQSAVVRIEANTCDGQSIGTGFLISPTLIATVEHVVDGANSIALKQGDRKVATGTVIGQDPVRDLALVQSSTPIHGAVLRLAPRAPQLGETVAALGFPLGLPLTVTKGSVSGLGRSVPINGSDRQQMVQTDAAVNPGNSGGPLLSVDSGDVIGLVDLGATEATGIAFAVSAQVAQPLLSAWRTAPQATPVATCSSPAPTQQASNPQPPPPSPTSTATYPGQAFTIDYPSSWQVRNAEAPQSWGGTDTTIVSPTDSSILVRVDVRPNTSVSSPQAAAQPVIDGLRGQPGYQQLDLSPDTVDGFPALHWEFLVDEGGVLMHKEDDFFIDTTNGDGVAVLSQAPADQYSGLASEFASLRSTLSMN
jgi:S1-C subfamily serine protease